MPDVAHVLKQEITRLARKEVKAAFDPLKDQLKDLAGELKKQQKALDSLQKTLQAQASQDQTASSPQPAEPNSRPRLTPQSIKRHRLRLKLSQGDLGRLLGVSTNTIVRWEAGSSKPRATHRESLIELRDIGIRQAKAQLQAL